MAEMLTGDASDHPRLWGDKRYHTWNYHLRQQFGTKVFKVPLDAGFTCPNRDGKVATGGCTFCSSSGSGEFAGDRRDDLRIQFQKVVTMMHQKWPQAKYLGYFQAYTNTYAPAAELRPMYETILAEPDVVGLSIATRPDCLPPDVVELLAELNQRTYLWVELGLQTIHDHTSERINRGHTYETYVEGLEKLQRHGIKVCTHIILGLPGEGAREMMETVDAVAHSGVEGIKIHLLHLLKKTPLAREYEAGQFHLLTQEEYTGLVVDALEQLPPEMVIHRLTGDGPRDLLLGPLWSLKKWEVLNGIDRELKARNSWQGKYYHSN